MMFLRMFNIFTALWVAIIMFVVAYGLEIVRGGLQAIHLTRFDMRLLLGLFVKTEPFYQANYPVLNNQFCVPYPLIACGT